MLRSLLLLSGIHGRTPHVERGHEDKIAGHKYKCINKSIYYAYVQGPLCDWAVEYLPQSLSPNVITLLSGVCYAASCVAFCGFAGFDFHTCVPAWLIYCVAVLIQLGLTLDNMDGKHARRTGNGSAMGMFLDHGLDALTSVTIVFLIGKAYCISNSAVIMGLFTLIVGGFWYMSLESYYTGCMNFGKFTGPDEGQLLASFFCVFAGILGCEFCKLSVNIPCFRMGYVPLQLSTVIVCVLLVVKISETALHWQDALGSAWGSAHLQRRFCRAFFVIQVAFIPLLVGVWTVYILSSQEAWGPLFPLVYTAASAQFLQSIHSLLICDAAAAEFQPIFRNQVASWALISANTAALRLTGGALVSELGTLVIINLVSWSSVICQFCSIIAELMTILDVNLISVKHQTKRDS